MPKEIVDKVLDQKLIDIQQTTTNYGATPYSDSIKLPTQATDGMAEGEIQDTTPKAYFNEYGTGIVGKNAPATDDALTEAGWVYDVNDHGEAGWWYPSSDDDPNPYKWITESGDLKAWTRGLPALKAYQNAADDIRDNAKTIIENL